MRNLLTANNIRLSAIDEQDAETIAKWFNTALFMRYYDYLPALPQTRYDVETFIKDFNQANDKQLFGIRLIESGQLLGITGFDDILWSNRTATLFIGIGESAYTEKGLGTEALSLLLDFGFMELNLHRIQLFVMSYNEAAISLYERLGFTKEGTLREFGSRDFKRYDLLVYGLLHSEWSKANS